MLPHQKVFYSYDDKQSAGALEWALELHRLRPSVGVPMKVKVSRYLQRIGYAAALVAALTVVLPNMSAKEARKLLESPTPIYPDLARKLQISGVVKAQITVGTDGKIKQTRFLGGHPILVDAVQNTLRNWRYAPASEESVLVLEFRFHP